jgi:hypothetical protein
MSVKGPEEILHGQQKQPPKEPHILTRKWGRVVEWFRNLLRSDDEKIDAIASRAKIFPSEHEWALHRLTAIQNTLQKRIEQGKRTETQQTMTKTLQAVSRLLYPEWTASQQASPIHPSLRIRALLRDNLKDPRIPEEKILQNLIEEISRAKDQDKSFSIAELGSSLLKQVPKDKPLIFQFVLALQKEDPEKFYDEFGYSLFSSMESASSEEMLTDTNFSLLLRIAHIFPKGDEEMLREVVRSLCKNIEETGVHLLPPQQHFSEDELRRRLSAFIGLQHLNTAFYCEGRTYKALLGQKSEEFKSLVDDILEFCQPNDVFNLESFKNCLKVLEECPRATQLSLLVELRERLKDPRKELPKELDSLDPTNRLDDLPRLAQKIFVHSGVRTPRGLGEAPQDEAVEIAHSPIIAHCIEDLSNPKISEAGAIANLVEQITEAQAWVEKDISTTELGSILSRLVPKKKHLLYQFAQALQKNDPKEFYIEIVSRLFYVLTSPDVDGIDSLILEVGNIFPQEKIEITETVKKALCSTIEKADLLIIPLEKQFSPEEMKKSLSKFIALKKHATIFKSEKEVNTALQKMIDSQGKEQFNPLVEGIIGYCHQKGVLKLKEFQECMAILSECPKQIQKTAIDLLFEELGADLSSQIKLDELDPNIRKIFLDRLQKKDH